MIGWADAGVITFPRSGEGSLYDPLVYEVLIARLLLFYRTFVLWQVVSWEFVDTRRIFHKFRQLLFDFPGRLNH